MVIRINLNVFYGLFLICLCLLFLILGFYVSPIAHLDSDLSGVAEYTNGILTISGILFGIWAVILSNKPTKKGSTGQFIFKNITMTTFYYSLVLFILSVVFLTMSGLKVYPSTCSLVFSAISCGLIAFFLTSATRLYANIDTT